MSRVLHASDFGHIHLHTESSTLDGMIKPSDLPRKIHELGQTFCAVTDHGTMSNVFRIDEEFLRYNQENGTSLKPIFGCELYFVPYQAEVKYSDMKSRVEKGMRDRANYHMTVICKNEVGFTNLIRLSSLAYTVGHYYKPRIDWELLQKYSEGLIITSGCLAGIIPQMILQNNLPAAWGWARRFKDVFEDDFYLEYMDHGIEEQQRIIPSLLQIGRELKITVIASNDSHYLNKEDWRPHEVLLATQTGTPIFIEHQGQRTLNPNRFSYEPEEFYVKSTDEMLQRIPPEYLITVKEIAEKCDVKIQYGRELAPSFPVPSFDFDPEWSSFALLHSGRSESLSDIYLLYLARKGMESLGYEDKREYEERFEREIAVIWKYRFSDLLLVVQDYMRWAHEKGIRSGPRGSAAGSLVVHCLGISDPACDPIKYGLLFERFINEDRVQPPDIDVDFQTGGRDRIMEYLKQKYGQDNVAAIGTRSTLHILGCLRDTARALGIPYEIQQRISKELEPYAGEEQEVDLEVSLEEVLAQSNYLTELSQKMPDLFKFAARIQGLQRQSSKHAAGAVVSKVPLLDVVPLMQRDGLVITQVDMFDVEHLGLLKVDLLGLKALSVIGLCIDLVRESNPNARIELKELSRDGNLCDPEVFKAIRESSGLGVFQIGTPQMQGYCRRLPIGRTPESGIDDLAQLIAAYRPSTARAGVTEQYIRVKEGSSPVEYYDVCLEEVLRPTGGKMIYQEQIIDVFQIIAGYTRSQADNVRRIMGKMLGEEALSKHKEAFYEGGRNKGLTRALVDRLWNDLKYFSIYGFNKSHSVAYALITYQTAYLKHYYPKEFLCASLSFEDDKTKFRLFLYEARRHNIEVLGPHINYSKDNFAIDPEGRIRFGLDRVKYCGGKSLSDILSKQPFTSFDDFLKRVNRTITNVRVQQYLIMSGAFDGFGERNEMLKQIGKFELGYSYKQYESEALGASVLSHSFDPYEPKARQLGFAPIYDVVNCGLGIEVGVCGIVSKVTTTMTKHDQEMAFVQVSDPSGTGTLIMWPDKWIEGKSFLKEGRCIAAKGKLGQKDSIEVRLCKELTI